MKKLFTSCLFAGLILLGLNSSAQELQKGAPGMWPAIIKYTATSPAFKSSAISKVDESGAAVSLNNGKVSKVDVDNTGIRHYRYQQYYNGITGVLCMQCEAEAKHE